MSSIFGPQALSVLARILAFCTAIPFHEAAHAYVSDKLGDPTARRMGRLTLNPVKHLDPWGLIAMLVIGIGWAKPVPINPAYYKNRKVGMAITAAAGPLSNLLLAYLCVVAYKLMWFSGTAVAGVLTLGGSVISQILLYLALLNINLAIFNLLPIPPFDGSRIFSLFLPEKAYFGIQKYEKYMLAVLLALLWVLPYATGFDPIGWLLGTFNTIVLSGLDWATGYINLLVGALGIM